MNLYYAVGAFGLFHHILKQFYNMAKSLKLTDDCGMLGCCHRLVIITVKVSALLKQTVYPEP